MQGAGDIGAVITVDSKKFAWVEGELNVLGDKNGVYFNQASFSVARNVSALNATDATTATGFRIDVSDACYFYNLRASNNNFGFRLSAVHGSYFRNIALANNIGSGISSSGTKSNVFEEIISTNSDIGINFADYDLDNILIGMTFSNNSTGARLVSLNNFHDLAINVTVSNNVSGIRQSGATGMSWINTNAINSGDGITMTFSSHSNRFSNIVAANNTLNGIVLEGDSDRNIFTGLLKVGNNNSADCNVSQTGAFYPGLDIGTSCNPGGSSTATLIKGPAVNAETTFIGKVTTDDAANNSDTNGIADYAMTLDWLSFSRLFRGWGENNGVFPLTNNQGPCILGETCRIWDWSILATDSLLTGVLGVPNGTMTYAHTWSDGSMTMFLANATEIIGDGIGNENGLCESNETCLYTPNIGSYQGHGALVPVSGFSNGVLSDITLLKYESNGR